MKLITYTLSFLLFSCTQTVQKNDNKILSDTTSVNINPAPQIKPQTAAKIEANDHLDSLRFDKFLNEALAFANKNSSKSSFKHSFDSAPDDSSFIIKADLQYGHIFDNNKHLLIRRTSSNGTNINIFLLKSNEFIPVCNRMQESLTYIDDTIRDVNGDNQKDFLVHWYPSSGCCKCDVYTVYVYQPEKGTFTANYEFVNPTFSPQEKVIRGVEYGHPGEAGLYKYKWNGLKIDTIEFIYRDQNNKGFYIKSQKQHIQTGKEAIKLNAVPKEYHSIEKESYGWFMEDIIN